MAKYKVGYDLKALTEEPKEKNTYIFPSKLAKMMNKVDLRVQLEASMLSLTFLMVGMILYSIYLAIYGGMNIWMKVFIIFNSICGMVLMSTYLITNFQQYKNFMDTMGIDSEHEKKKIKERGNIIQRIKQAHAERIERKVQAKMIEQKELKPEANNITELMKESGVDKEVKVNEESTELQKEMFGEEIGERRLKENE